MITRNKLIIAIEGMDGVGKTTLLNNWKSFLHKNQKNPITKAIMPETNIIFEHFPTDNSEARRIRKTEKNIDEKELQKLMMEDLVQRIDKFCNKDTEDIMICDRFLFSNYLYSFDKTLSDFIIELNSIWNQYNLPLYDIFVMNHVKTILVDIPEEERLKRLFMNEDRIHRDSNETEEYQQALYDRYYNMLSNPDSFDETRRLFNIKIYSPRQVCNTTNFDIYFTK